MARKPAGAPAIMLIVSGVFGLIYAVGYFLWTLWPLGWGILVIVANIDKHGFSSETLTNSLLFLSMPFLQLLMFFFTVITAAITMFAGVRFRQWRSPGLVWLGIVCSLATPVVGAVANSASMFNCGTVGAGIFGCLMGNVGTIPIFVVGLVASILGAVTMFGDAANNFDAAD
ncbi:MAG: hypothetical protein H6737_10495 [Alphaproteobacteria bacterium]|nr:hypothetical protein [Alphaproteobacteria bacterium]